MSVNSTDHCLIGEKDNGSIWDHSEQVSTHPSIQTPHSFILKHFQQSLEEGMVFALVPGHFLPQSSPNYFYGKNIM